MKNATKSQKYIAQAIEVFYRTSLQIVIFVFIYESVFRFYVTIYGHPKGNLSYGIQLYYGLYFLALLAFAKHLTDSLFDYSFGEIAFAVSCVLAWVIYWSNIFSAMPLRAILVSFAGTASFFLITLLRRNKIEAKFL